MWYSAFGFYFEGHFISKKKKNNVERRECLIMEMKLVNILEHKHHVMWIFFVCIHDLRVMYIDSTHHFHGKGLFLF